jgi:hypothetical protein
MSSNSSSNMGSILGSRINKGIRESTLNGKTTQDLSIASTRAGWQQRFGAMQLEDVIPNAYALFGGWSGSSTTVGP